VSAREAVGKWVWEKVQERARRVARAAV